MTDAKPKIIFYDEMTPYDPERWEDEYMKSKERTPTMPDKPRSRRIETKMTPTLSGEKLEANLGGWLCGKQTYLWFGLGDTCIGTLDGYRLKRLCKAVLHHMEANHA